MINKLSKQIYKLQMAKYGKFQMNFHVLERTVTPTASQPLVVDLTDFSSKRTNTSGTINNGCRMYQVNSAGTGIGTVTEFITQSTEIVNNPYWTYINRDAPDTGMYLAQQATYFFSVKGTPNLDDTRVRFDIIAQKPGTVNTKTIIAGQAPICLPYSLIYMKNLVGGIQNRIAPTSFKKYFSKTVYINSQPSGGSTSAVKATTANTVEFSFKITPNKVCIQNLTNPTVTPGPPEVTDGNWSQNNIPITQPLWLVISTNDVSSTANDRVDIKMSRRISWRDHIGSAATQSLG